MVRSLLVFTVAVAVIGFALAERAGWPRFGIAGRGAATKQVIAATPLFPPVDAIGPIPCEAGSTVEVVYRLVNRSEQPISGLRPGTMCACEAAGAPSSAILPGESTVISLKVRAPRVGTIHRQIPIIADAFADPVAVIAIQLRVDSQVPRLLPPAEEMSVTFVFTDPRPQELVVESIEANGSAPWILGVRFDPELAVESQPLNVEEFVEPDPAFLRRQYSIPVLNRSLAPGHYVTSGTLRVAASPTPTSLPIRILVLDSIAIVPNPLVLTRDEASQRLPRRVCVLSRLDANLSSVVAKYDDRLVDVVRAGPTDGTTAAFDIVTLAGSANRLETKVAFVFENDQSRVLTVQFNPADSP
jgi:hypothetical protein